MENFSIQAIKLARIWYSESCYLTRTDTRTLLLLGIFLYGPQIMDYEYEYSLAITRGSVYWAQN